MKKPSIDSQIPMLSEFLRESSIRNYLLIASGALIVYYFQMVERGGDLGPLLAVLLAVPGLVARWPASPMFFLIMTIYLLIDPYMDLIRSSSAYGYGSSWSRYGRTSGIGLNSFLLSASVLVYLGAQYRLLSFLHQSMPDDPPPRRKGQAEPKVPRRPSTLFHDVEIGRFLGLSLVFTLAGILIWILIAQFESGRRLSALWGLERPIARLMLFIWVFVTGAILFAVSFRYLNLRRMNRLQARLMLQDMFWQETRREHERVARWRRWFQRRQDLSSATKES